MFEHPMPPFNQRIFDFVIECVVVNDIFSIQPIPDLPVDKRGTTIGV